MRLNPSTQKHTPPHRPKPSRWFPKQPALLHFQQRSCYFTFSRAGTKRRSALEPGGEVVPPFPILDNDFTLLPHPRATRGTRHAVQMSCEAVSMQRALVWANQFQETQQSCSRKYKNKDHTQMIWSEITVPSLGTTRVQDSKAGHVA